MIIPLPKKQQGVVLVITLLMVFILAGLAITISAIPTTDQRIAANTRDQILANEAANAALAEAKTWLVNNWINNASLPKNNCGKAIQPNTFGFTNYAANQASWWTTYGCNGTKYPNTVSVPPSYIIIYLDCNASGNVNADVFLVLARGVGATTTATAFAEGTVLKGPGGGSASSGTPGARLITGSKPGFSANWTGYLANNMSAGIPQSAWGSGTVFWGGWCPSGASISVACSRNCAGQVQINGYSGSDPAPCQTKYGAWVNPGNPATVSTIQLKDGNGTWRAISCY